MLTMTPKLNNQISIDVIIPAYNAESLITRCLESLINAYLAEERISCNIIIINDGSTDKTQEILRVYANEYENIRVIQSENLGVSAARNKGLDVSNSDWLMFVDADDYVTSDFFTSASDALSITSSDLYIMNVCKQYASGVQQKIIFSDHLISLDKVDAIGKMMRGELYHAPWGKIFNGKIARQLRFLRDITVGEDLLYCMQFLLTAREICLTPYSGYVYVINKDSVTNTSVTNKKVDDIISVLEKIREICPDHIEKKYFDILVFEQYLSYACSKSFWYFFRSGRFAELVSLSGRDKLGSKRQWKRNMVVLILSSMNIIHRSLFKS